MDRYVILAIVLLCLLWVTTEGTKGTGAEGFRTERIATKRRDFVFEELPMNMIPSPAVYGNAITYTGPRKGPRQFFKSEKSARKQCLNRRKTCLGYMKTMWNDKRGTYYSLIEIDDPTKTAKVRDALGDPSRTNSVLTIDNPGDQRKVYVSLMKTRAKARNKNKA